MPVPTVQKDRPLIPDGEHTLILKEVFEKDFDSQYSKREDGKVTKWLWRFESTQTTENDEPYEHIAFTNTSYGHHKASLTILLDMLVPGMTPERAAEFDTDTLLHKRFKGMIRHTKTDKGDTRAELVYISPANKKGQAVQVQDPDDDTFAGE